MSLLPQVVLLEAGSLVVVRDTAVSYKQRDDEQEGSELQSTGSSSLYILDTEELRLHRVTVFQMHIKCQRLLKRPFSETELWTKENTPVYSSSLHPTKRPSRRRL